MRVPCATGSPDENCKTSISISPADRILPPDATIADADAFFPRFDASDWQVVSREAHPADARHAHAFEFVDYQRRESASPK